MGASKRVVRESLEERLVRLAPYVRSTRFALTEADVRWDYAHADRYAVKS